MKSIGIDLGTTNSVACTILNGRYKFLQFHHRELLPSVILYKDGKVTVGDSAKKKAKIYSENYIYSAKTYMGNMEKSWKIEDRTFTPVDVAAEVLGEIYKEAQKLFGKDEEIQAVITTPAYFSGSQNAATADAGRQAGFVVKQILAEPVAAALAYASESLKNSEKIYVVDLGGGTFDVTLLEVVSQNEFRTLMKDGDNHLGGDDFDKVIEEIMQSRIRQDIGVDLSSLEDSGLSTEAYGRAKQKLLQEAEKVKCSLSDSEVEDVSIVNLFPYQDGNYDFTTEITRDEFLDESSKLIRHIKDVIRRRLEDSSYSVDDVDRVILVGGSSNMPFVREYIESYFKKKPYADKDLSKLVAMGAAIRADNERGDTITLHDIIAHSLGIELFGNRYEKILEKDMEYPCKKAKIFTTSYDYQKVVDIVVYEGENTEEADSNNYFGGFTVENIQKAKQGIPQIEITFEFDKSCILHVSARDLHTGASGSKDISIDRSLQKKKIIKERNKQENAYDIVVLIDTSYSMLDCLDVAKSACYKLVRNLINVDIHRVAIVSFESCIGKHCDLTNDLDVIEAAVDDIHIGGSTNMAAGFNEAGNILQGQKGIPLVIVMTDGMPDDRNMATYVADKLKNKGVRINAIGAGSVDHDYLKSLASSPKEYYQIEDMNGLAGAFAQISNSLKLQ